MPLIAALLLLGLLFLLAKNIQHNGFAYFATISFIGLTNGAVYALVALGYTLVYGILELINFAHGDVFMLGGMISATMLISSSVFGLKAGASTSALIPALLVSLVVAMVGCGLINASIEFVAYRPLRGAPRLAPLITAIGMSFILQNVAIAWKGPGYTAIPNVLPHGNVFSIHGVVYTWEKFIVVLVTIPVLVGLMWLVLKTRQGKAMRAAAQDRDAAAMMGINVNRTISFTFLIAGALAGAAGLLYALYFGQVRYDTGFQLGPDRVHGRGARRHRELAGCRPRRALDRVHPGLQRGPHLAHAGQRLDPVDRVLDPHPDPRLPSRGPARRADAGRSLTCGGGSALASRTPGGRRSAR